MADKKPTPIPPRHRANVNLGSIEEVPHGWEVTFTVRRLNREPTPGLDPDATALYSVWGHLSFLLQRGGMDLEEMLESIDTDWHEGAS